MGKRRRTRKAKVSPHHRFSVTWQPDVKSQNTAGIERVRTKTTHKENVALLAQKTSNEAIKADLVKSAIIVSLVLSVELVIYLFSNKLR